MIAGISMTGNLQGLYPQYQANAVRPVKKIEKELPKDQPEEIRESKTAQKMAARAYEEYQKSSGDIAGEVKATYSENPYEQMRKNLEASLLTGQNIDQVA